MHNNYKKALLVMGLSVIAGGLQAAPQVPISAAPPDPKETLKRTSKSGEIRLSHELNG